MVGGETTPPIMKVIVLPEGALMLLRVTTNEETIEVRLHPTEQVTPAGMLELVFFLEFFQ